MDKMLVRKFSISSDVIFSRHKTNLLRNLSSDASENSTIFLNQFKAFTDELDILYDALYEKSDESTRDKLLTNYKLQIIAFRELFNNGFF
jgi:hypothetical protein